LVHINAQKCDATYLAPEDAYRRRVTIVGRHPDGSTVFVARGTDGDKQRVEEQQQPQPQQHREETKAPKRNEAWGVN
jgi:hypothetical protein